MNDYVRCWKKYADFNGRAGRQEYWMFFLFNFIFGFVAALIPIIGIFISSIYGIAVFLPRLAVTVRRLHDIGKSGAWYCVIFIPLAGPIWLLILLVTEGERKANVYGEDPRVLNEYYSTSSIPNHIYTANDSNVPDNDQTIYRRLSSKDNYHLQNNEQQQCIYYCTKCGGKVPKGIEVCPKCGNYMPETNYR